MGTYKLSKNLEAAYKKEEKRQEILKDMDKVMSALGKYNTETVSYEILARDLDMTVKRVDEAYTRIQLDMEIKIQEFTHSFKYKLYLYLIQWKWLGNRIEAWINK